MTSRPNNRERIDAGIVPLPTARTREEIAERNQRVFQMHEEGASLRAIGQDVGCSKSNIEKILRSERKHLQQLSTLLLSTPPVGTPIEQDTFETPRRDTSDLEAAIIGHPTFRCPWCQEAVHASEAAEHARRCRLERDRRGAQEAVAIQDRFVEQLRAQREAEQALTMDRHLRW